jgi:hypothetical protein
MTIISIGITYYFSTTVFQKETCTNALLPKLVKTISFATNLFTFGRQGYKLCMNNISYRMSHLEKLCELQYDIQRKKTLSLMLNKTIYRTRKYMHAETLALLTKPLYFLNMKYLK